MKFLKNILKYTIFLPFYIRKKKNYFNIKLEELNRKIEKLEDDVKNNYVSNQEQLFNSLKLITNDKKNKIYFKSIPVIYDQKIRSIQIIESYILKKIDLFCRKYNINYWLDSGTLLGAFRNGRFIPWDDDVDTCMMRADLCKFKDTLAKNKDIEIYLVENFIPKCGCLGSHVQYRVCLKGLPTCVFIDIFVFDYIDDSNLMIQYIKFRNEFEKQITNVISKTEYFEKLSNSLKTIKEKFQSKRDCNYIVWGIDNFTPKNFFDGNFIFNITKIFPLIEMKFENHLFYCPRVPSYVLTKYYKHPFELPNDIFKRRHEICSSEDLNFIDNFIMTKKLG